MDKGISTDLWPMKFKDCDFLRLSVIIFLSLTCAHTYMLLKNTCTRYACKSQSRFLLLLHLSILVFFSYLLFFADCLKGWPLGKKKSKKNYLFKIFKLFFLGKFGIKCKCISFAVVCIFVSFIFPWLFKT